MVFLGKVTVRPKVVDNFTRPHLNRTIYRVFADEVQVASFSSRHIANKWKNRIMKRGLEGTDYEHYVNPYHKGV